MIRKYFAIILGAILFLMLSAFIFNDPVEADIIDDLSNSTFSGYVMLDERSEVMFENITIYAPEDENLFGIPLTVARYKIVQFGNDDMVDDILLAGNIGLSDTFYLSYRKLDEPFSVNAGGVLYDVARHWLGEDAPPVYLGAYMMDNSEILLTFLGSYEFTPGYYISADVLLGMEDFGNRNFLDGKVAFGHNFNPEGTVYGEIFVYNISGATYYGGGAGYRF